MDLNVTSLVSAIILGISTITITYYSNKKNYIQRGGDDNHLERLSSEEELKQAIAMSLEEFEEHENTNKTVVIGNKNIKRLSSEE